MYEIFLAKLREGLKRNEIYLFNVHLVKLKYQGLKSIQSVFRTLQQRTTYCCNNFSHCIVLRKLFDPDHFNIWTWHVVWCQNFLLSSSTSILTLKVPKSSIHTLKVVGEQFSLPYQCPSARENTFKSLLKKMELFWPSRVGKHSGRGCPGSSLILDS